MTTMRDRAITLLVQNRHFSVEDATRVENNVWEKKREKYALIIRRLLSGMSLDESLIELEPYEEADVQQIVAEGELQCPKCRSKRIHRQELQTRSADESATCFCCCSDCGKRWKF